MTSSVVGTRPAQTTRSSTTSAGVLITPHDAMSAGSVTLSIVITQIIVPALQDIAKFLQQHSAEIQNILSGAWTAVQAIITGALALIQGIFLLALALLQGNWQGAWVIIQTTVSTVWAQIQTLLTLGLSLLQAVWIATLTTLQQWWNNILNSLYTFAQETWTNIAERIRFWMGIISSRVIKALDDLKKAWSDAWNNFKTILNDIWLELQRVADKVVKDFQSIIEGFIGYIKTIRIPNPFAELLGWLDDLIDGLKEAWRLLQLVGGGSRTQRCA